MYEGLLPIEVAVESSIKSTTPAIPAGLDDPAGGPADPLDDILRQIIGGYFVLTDGQGSVSKWSEPAELLFGRPAAEVLGQSFFQTLIKPPVPAEAETWRRFLEAGEAPTVPGRVEVTGVMADGDDFPMEAVFVPVKLDEGFDFSLFLEDLGFELPVNLMLQRMRAQHPVVVRAMRQALEPEPQPWEGWRTAGTLVVFRPLKATPWVEAELARREAARAEADAEVEERLTNLDPGIQGNSVADLDDAAAVVARLLSAMERIDELERVALGLPGQLEEARQAAERRAEVAEREAAALRAEVQRIASAGTGGDDKELLARLDRLERAKLDAEQDNHDRGRALDVAEAARAELAARLDRLERQRAESSAAADARLATAVAEAQRRAEEAVQESARRAAEVEARIAEIGTGADESAFAAQLEQVRAEHEEAAQAARTELAATIDRLERDRAREAEASRAELAAALQRVEHVQREADALREQLATVTVEHAEAGDDRRRLEELARDAEATRARIDGLREELADAAGLRDEIATLRAELATLSTDPGELETVRAELEALRAGAAELSALRSQVEALRGGLPDLEPLYEQVAAIPALDARLDALQTATAGLATFEDRLNALQSADDLDALRAELATLQQSAAELTAVREEIAALRAGTAEVEALRRDHDALRAQQEQVRGWLDEARRERDEFRAAGERTVAQVEELRRSLEERENDPTIPAAQAVERDVVDAIGGQVEALRMRLAEITAAGDATTRRIDELAETERALSAHVETLASATETTREDALARVAEVADANHAVAQRLDELAADRRVDELTAAVEELRSAGPDPRVDELAAAVEGLRSAGPDPRVEELAAAVEALNLDEAVALAAEAAKSGRDNASAVEELQERLAEVDRGAGGVLADVRTLRDRLDEVSTLASTAQEAATSGRPEVEELRAAVSRLGAEVEVARSQVEHAGQEALGAREQAATAGEAAAAARDDAAAARDEAVALRRELTAADERQTALAGDVKRAADAADAAKTDAAAAKKATEALTDIDAKTQALRTEMTAGRERLEAIGERVERLGKDVVEAGQTAGAALEAQGAELRTELAAVRRIAEESRDGMETLRADIEGLRGVREDAAAARSAAEAGDRKVEAMQAELTFALKQLEDVKAGLTSAGQAAVIARREAEQAKRAAQQSAADGNSGVTEVFQQLLAAARGEGMAGAAPRSGLRRGQTPGQDLKRKSEITARPPRHGFDDAARPMAILGLDGRFRELNPAFARLVGYQENAFAKAYWPSPHDRAGYQQQQEQLRQLASGEIDSVDVQSTYMHGQGLMVPVVGTLKVVPGEDGLPLHLLLEAEDRHTS
jgi:PAS domain S-box-containing protein